MNRVSNWLSRLSYAGMLALLMISHAVAATGDLDDPVAVEAFVDGLVMPLMKNSNSPSGTVAIVKDGQLIFAKGYGYQDVEKRIPVDPYQTLFRPGSVSKLFAWVAVMQQVEQGKLDLDADVNNYLTAFKIKDTFDQPITLRDIMTHSPGWEDGGLGYLIIDDPDRAIPMVEALERYQPLRVNPPGKQTSYSNYGTALAGHIVAELSGLSFTDYIDQHILQPLGMNSSSFAEPLPEHLLKNMAKSYAFQGGKYVEKPFEIVANFSPAGALSATATDMVKFAQAILNGGELNGQRILQQATVDEMLTRNFSHDDRMMGLALGFYETDFNGIRLVGHGGDTAWFHSNISIDLERNMAFFVSFGSPGGGAVRSTFPPAFFNEFFPVDEAPPVPPADFASRAARYAGTYGFWRSNFSGIERAFGLQGGGISVVPTADNTLFIGMGGSGKQYVEVEKNLFRELDPNASMAGGMAPRLVGFQENSQGEITGFVMDGMPFMSTRKLSFYQTSGFSQMLIGFSLLVFLFVLLRRFFQRAAIRTLPAAEKGAISASVYAAAANWLVVIVGAVVITLSSDKMTNGIPFLMKLWLWLPIIASLLGVYLLYRTVIVWKSGVFGGVLARVRYSVITFCALAMAWVFYYWNILGFQYLTD